MAATTSSPVRTKPKPKPAKAHALSSARAVNLPPLAPRLRILISYYYFKSVDIDALLQEHFTPPYPQIFADSGAFTAYIRGETLDRRDYAAWLHKWRHRFTVYANLDVKGDVDAGLKNQAWLESQGLTPLPVFHGGEPWSVLTDLIATYPYIALGGIAGSSVTNNYQSMMAWLVHCFKLARGKSVYHGFGMTNWSVLKALPWYSVDSTSWSQGFMYGQCPVFDPRTGKFIKLQLGDKSSWYKHSALVRSYGFDPADFADRSRNHHSLSAGICALSYMTAEAWLRKRWGPQTIPFQGMGSTPPDPGFHLYLVEGNAQLNRTMHSTRALARHHAHRPITSTVNAPVPSPSRGISPDDDQSDPSDPGPHVYRAGDNSSLHLNQFAADALQRHHASPPGTQIASMDPGLNLYLADANTKLRHPRSGAEALARYHAANSGGQGVESNELDAIGPAIYLSNTEKHHFVAGDKALKAHVRARQQP